MCEYGSPKSLDTIVAYYPAVLDDKQISLANKVHKYLQC